jgi:hypothetical protein
VVAEGARGPEPFVVGSWNAGSLGARTARLATDAEVAPAPAYGSDAALLAAQTPVQRDRLGRELIRVDPERQVFLNGMAAVMRWDCALFQETWLAGSEDFMMEHLETVARRGGTRQVLPDGTWSPRLRGGLLTAAREPDAVREMRGHGPASVEALYTRVEGRGLPEKLVVVSVYWPPGESMQWEATAFVERVTELITEGFSILMMGDFNVNVLADRWVMVASGRSRAQVRGRKATLLELLQLGLVQITDRGEAEEPGAAAKGPVPTHQRGEKRSCIDLCLVTPDLAGRATLCTEELLEDDNRHACITCSVERERGTTAGAGKSPRKAFARDCRAFVAAAKEKDGVQAPWVEEAWTAARETIGEAPEGAAAQGWFARVATAAVERFAKRRLKMQWKEDPLFLRWQRAREGVALGQRAVRQAASPAQALRENATLKTAYEEMDAAKAAIRERASGQQAGMAAAALERVLTRRNDAGLKRLGRSLSRARAGGGGDKVFKLEAVSPEIAAHFKKFWSDLWSRDLSMPRRSARVDAWLARGAPGATRCAVELEGGGQCEAATEEGSLRCAEHGSAAGFTLLLAPWFKAGERRGEPTPFSIVWTRVNPGEWPARFASERRAVTVEEIVIALKGMAWGKAGGPSGLLVDVLKVAPGETKAEAVRDLDVLYATLVRSPTGDDCTLVLLHKKKERELAKNYRPINLSAAEFRLDERVTYNRIVPWYEYVLSLAQFGFRWRTGTVECLLVLLTAAQMAVMRGQPLYLVALDLTKAFDTVAHDALLEQLGAMGLDLESVKLMLALLSGHVSVVGEGEDALMINILCGVLQGGLLSPVDFNCFLDNSLPAHVAEKHGTRLLMRDGVEGDTPQGQAGYADDRTLMADNVVKAQCLLKWVAGPGLPHAKGADVEDAAEVGWVPSVNSEHNLGKCEATVVNGDIAEFEIGVGDTLFKVVPHITVLGMAYGGEARMWRESAVSKVAGQMIMVSDVWRKVCAFVPAKKSSDLCFTYIMPVGLYGCPLADVQDAETGKSLDTVAPDFARVVLKVPWHVHKVAMMEFLGWYRPTARGRYLRVKFALGLPNTVMPLITQCFDLQRTHGLPWWTETVAIAAQLGFDERLLEAVARPRLDDAASDAARKARKAEGAEDVRLLKAAAQEAEREHWRAELAGIPPGLLNWPSTGSRAFKAATVPGAHALFCLRYDINEHLRRHEGLVPMDHECSCCTEGTMESNVHVLFACRADLLSLKQRGEFETARALLVAHRAAFVHDGERTDETYLLWLTGPHLKVWRDAARKKAVRLTAGEINVVVEAGVVMRRVRRAAWKIHREEGCIARRAAYEAPPPLTPQGDDREAVATRMFQCRSLEELEEVMAWTGYTRDVNDPLRRFSSMHSLQWAPVFAARGTTHQILTNVLGEVDWQLPYLLMVSPADRAEFARERAVHDVEVKIESGGHQRRRRRMSITLGHGARLGWVDRLPYEYASGGPLVEAWFAAEGEAERRLLVRMWPVEIMVTKTKWDPVFNELMTAIASALTAGELEVEVDEWKGAKQYGERDNDGKRMLRMWLLRDWHAVRGKHRITAVRVRRRDGSAIAPRREVWRHVAAQVGARSPEERRATVLEWRDEIMLGLREVERDSRPDVRFRAV